MDSPCQRPITGLVGRRLLRLSLAIHLSMDWDVTLDALGDEYRRRLLALLLDQETVAVPEELHLGEESLDQLHLALRHQHLPRLEAADFVDWDSATQRVTRGPKFDEIAPVVELLRDHARERGDPWL